MLSEGTTARPSHRVKRCEYGSSVSAFTCEMWKLKRWRLIQAETAETAPVEPLCRVAIALSCGSRFMIEGDEGGNQIAFSWGADS